MLSQWLTLQKTTTTTTKQCWLPLCTGYDDSTSALSHFLLPTPTDYFSNHNFMDTNRNNIYEDYTSPSLIDSASKASLKSVMWKCSMGQDWTQLWLAVFYSTDPASSSRSNSGYEEKIYFSHVNAKRGVLKSTGTSLLRLSGWRRNLPSASCTTQLFLSLEKLEAILLTNTEMRKEENAFLLS